MLIVNPLAEIVVEREGEAIVALLLRAPVVGRGLLVTRLRKTEDPDLFRRMRRAVLELLWEPGSTPKAAVPFEIESRLAHAGLLVEPDAVPPVVRFSCALVPSALVPAAATTRRAPAAGPLTFNRTTTIDADRVSLEHAPSGVRVTYQADRADLAELDRLRAGTLDPAELPSDRAELLRLAGILQSGGDRGGTDAIDEARRRFSREGLATVQDLVPPLQLAAMRAYYRELFDQGYVLWEEKEGEERGYFRYNEEVSVGWHRQLARFVSTIAGEPLKPSFTYLFGYREGAALKRHVDREQCEITVVWQLDFEPEPAARVPWALYMEPADRPAEFVSFHLALGEALIFRGRERPHYRDPLPVGQRATTVALCYVHERFAGSLD